ncbi:hypothetical protein pb186bvf_018930 [Paramecium bursaria]
MYRIVQLLKHIDILGLNLNFSINSNRTYNTWLGLTFSLLLLSFLLYSFIQMIDDIQSGTNPIKQKSSFYLQQNEGFQFPAYSFIFAVAVLDQNSQYIINTPEKTYFTLRFRKFVYGGDLTTYGFGKCNKHIIRYLQDHGAQFDTEHISCVNDDIISQDGGIELQNSFHLKNFTKYQLQILKCKNSTTANYVCATNQEIDAKLDNGQVIYTFPQFEFNPLNYSNPYQIKVGVRYNTINVKDTKIMNLSYKQSQSITEQNILYFFPSQKLDKGIEYYEAYNDQQSGSKDGFVFGIYLYLDDQNIIYKRTYQNIFNIFGSIGGTFSVLKILFMILLQPLQKLSLSITMFNKISDKQKPIRIIDYFKSKKQRYLIEEYYKVIQKALELESYMDIMLKYENNLLTFRLDKLVLQNSNLLKSQNLQFQQNCQDAINQQSNKIKSQQVIQIIDQQTSQPININQRSSRISLDVLESEERLSN